jgi:hypothetical protein
MLMMMEQKKAMDVLFLEDGIEEESVSFSFKHHNMQTDPMFT